MRHIILFLLLMLLTWTASAQISIAPGQTVAFAIDDSGQVTEHYRLNTPTNHPIGRWYNCSHTDTSITRPDGAFDHDTWELKPWFRERKAVCDERGHYWKLMSIDQGPVEGGPFVQDDYYSSVEHRVLLRDSREYECTRCRSTRRIIRWTVQCRTLWRREAP